MKQLHALVLIAGITFIAGTSALRNVGVLLSLVRNPAEVMPGEWPGAMVAILLPQIEPSTNVVAGEVETIAGKLLGSTTLAAHWPSATTTVMALVSALR